MLTPQQENIVAHAMEWALNEIPAIPEEERRNIDTVMHKNEQDLSRADFILVLRCLESFYRHHAADIDKLPEEHQATAKQRAADIENTRNTVVRWMSSRFSN